MEGSPQQNDWCRNDRTKHSITGFSHYYLLPHVRQETTITYRCYSADLRRPSTWQSQRKFTELESRDKTCIWNWSSEICRKTKKDVETKVPVGACFNKLEPRDLVLVKNSTPRGGFDKLRSLWEDEVVETVERHENEVTYGIKFNAQQDRIRVLHQNMFIPINNLFGTLDHTPHKLAMKLKRPIIIKKKDGHHVVTENFSTSSSEELGKKLEFTTKQLHQFALNQFNAPMTHQYTTNPQETTLSSARRSSNKPTLKLENSPPNHSAKHLEKTY